jgi:hypothetical protein
MVFTGIGGLIGLALLVAGVAVVAAFLFGRDSDGYFNTDRRALDSPGYAITTEEIDLGEDALDWAPDDVLGDVRIQVEGKGGPVFVGIGRDEYVARYLDGVARDQLVGFDGDRPEFAHYRGGAPRGPPARQRFWVAKTEGSGEQALTWDAEFGRWTAVVMKADGSRGIAIEADAGVRVGWVIWVGVGLILIGLLMSAGAVAAALLIARGASRGSPAAA